MKKIISLILILTLCVSCALALASCGGAPKDAGAEISIYLGEEIYDFDPTDYYANSNQEAVMSLLFEPLFKLSDDGDLLKDGVAKNYRIDKTAHTITIELRETHWSDEQRVTADDFIYAWRNVLLDPTNANPAAALLYDIENAAEIKRGEKTVYDLGAKKTDIYEITITYREDGDPDRLLKNLASVATSPIRQDTYENASGYWTKLLNYAVTNGPFRIDTVDYEQGNFTIARNIGYHQLTSVVDYTKQVTPAKLISFSNASGEDTAYTYKQLEDKAVFYMGEASLEDRAAYKNKAKVADALSTYTYVFNTDNPLFANANVRRALSLAIDRNEIINKIVFGKAATGLLPETVINCDNGRSFRRNNEILSAAANLEEANRLLREVDFTGMSKAFTLTVDSGAESRAIAEYVKTVWNSLGFDVSLKFVGAKQTTIVDFKSGDENIIYDSELQLIVKNAAKGNRDFDVIGVDWQMYSQDAFVALSAFSSNFNGNGTDFNGMYVSFGGWKSEQYDTLISEAYAAKDKKERQEKLKAAEELLISEGAVAPLVFNQNFAFVGRDLSNVSFDGFGNAILTKAKQRNYEEYLNR